MFELRGVTKTFGKQVVIDNMNLSFGVGETTVLIGPSGCGKSTLLRMLVGLVLPDKGSVAFSGEGMNVDNLRKLRVRMGYVIQDGGLFSHLTAREDVSIMARYLKWDKKRIDERVDQLSESTRLPKALLEKIPVQLSGGQRQRLGIMRALMLDPDVVLLDEPMGALDPLVRYDLQEDLRSIFRTLRKSVIMVTHDMGEAGFFGDRVLLLNSGRVEQDGTLNQLLSTPATEFVSRFIQAQRLPQASAN